MASKVPQNASVQLDVVNKMVTKKVNFLPLQTITLKIETQPNGRGKFLTVLCQIHLENLSGIIFFTL